jgi:hypothetical protein
MKTTIFTFVFAALLCPALSSEPGHGTICVLAQPENFKSRVMTPGDEYNPATLKFKIDKGEVVVWPHKENLKIEGLDTNDRHLIVIISDGKRIQSAWFRFSDFKTMDLCFFYDGYGGIQLSQAKHSVCKCK